MSGTTNDDGVVTTCPNCKRDFKSPGIPFGKYHCPFCEYEITKQLGN